MTKCPNPKCFYPNLVLLEKRKKYKCAKCGKLYSQIEIELKEFQEWNESQRKEDREKIFGKPQEQKKLSDYEKKQRALESYQKWREAHPDKNAEFCKLYYEKNKDKVLAKQRAYRIKRGQARNDKLKVAYHKNIDDSRLKKRISYWRNEQKQLALLKLENEVFKAYNAQFQNLLPTLLLS